MTDKLVITKVNIVLKTGTGGTMTYSCGRTYRVPEELADSWVASGKAYEKKIAVIRSVLEDGSPVQNETTKAPVSRRRRE